MMIAFIAPPRAILGSAWNEGFAPARSLLKAPVMVHDDTLPQAKDETTRDGAPANPAPADEEWPTLETLRMRYIHRAIEHTGRNKTRAATLLGIDRRTLNRILARERARRAAAERGQVH